MGRRACQHPRGWRKFFASRRLSKNQREGQSPFTLQSSPAACTAGAGRFLRRKIPFSRAKIVSLQFPRPEIRRILAETGEGGSGGGARSARPVGEAARSKPNEQGSTASRQAQQDDHCELWGACSPVHQRVKKTFLTRLVGQSPTPTSLLFYATASYASCAISTRREAPMASTVAVKSAQPLSISASPVTNRATISLT